MLQRRPIDDPEVRAFAVLLETACVGPANARTAAAMGRILYPGHGRNVDRKLRALAHAATMAGVPVASGNRGYFLANRPEHLDETISRLEEQAKEQFQRTKRLRELQESLRREIDGAIWDARHA